MTDILRARANPDLKEEIADKMLEMAAAGNLTAMKYVYDRLDGAPRQSVEVTGDREKPVPLVILRAATDATST